MPRRPGRDSATMRTPSPLPAGLTAPFHIADARAAGVSPARLRATDLDAPFRAVRALDAPHSVVDLARAYGARMATHQFFSHTTAALLHEMPIPWRLQRRREVHVSVLRPYFPPQGRGVRGHLSSSPRPLELVGGLSTLVPAETWCELAAMLGHNELVIAADHLVRRKWPQSSVEKLRAAVEAMASKRHVLALRAALECVRPGTDSPKESELRLLLVQSGLPEPVIHFEVYDADGGFVATPDLSYPELKIAIEYEGAHHQTDQKTYADDILRRELLVRAGWLLILVINEHLRDHPVWTVGRVRDAIAQRSR